MSPMLKHVSEFPCLGWIICHCMYSIYHILFIYYMNEHLNCFHLFAVKKNAAMNIGVQVSVWVSAFSSLGYIPRSGIDELYGNAMFYFLRKCQTVFHSSSTILLSHEQCRSVPISPYPLQQLFCFLVFCF